MQTWDPGKTQETSVILDMFVKAISHYLILYVAEGFPSVFMYKYILIYTYSIYK